MKKIALLIALCLSWPTFSHAADTVDIGLSNPGADKTTSVNIVFPRGTAWDAGDLVTVTFDAGESAKIDKPLPDCGYSPDLNRRFNPGPDFWVKCKDNPFEGKFAKLYTATIGETVAVDWSKDLPQTWVPGFLMPIIPGDLEAASQRIENLFKSIIVNGIPCRPEKGCQIVSTATERKITFTLPEQVAMMRDLTITIPSYFGIVCPMTKGSYSINVEAKIPASEKVETVDPMVTNPSFEINPKFPGERAKWKFAFQLGKAGKLEPGSMIMVRLPAGFAKLQSTYPGFSIEMNGLLIGKNAIRIGQGESFDQMLIPCAKEMDAGTPVTVELNVINPAEGDVTCHVLTSTDTLPATFGPEKIEFSQVTTASETTAGLPTSIATRFKSQGHKAGDNLLAILPSEINKGCQIAFNGQTIANPTLGLKNVQFELPSDLAPGAFCLLQFSDVLNPLENSAIKVSITNSTFEIPWNVTPYQSRFSVATIPPVANKPCAYTFHITPPPDLLDVERKQITIVGPWNRIIRPQMPTFAVMAGTIRGTGEFDSANNLVVVRLEEEFPNMKPITVEIPSSAGFGSPDQTSDFTVKISSKEMKASCKVMPAPPAYSYTIKTKSGKDVSEIEGGWSNEPVVVNIMTSSGKSDISVMGLDETVKATKSDLSFTIDKTTITDDLPVSISDVGGTTRFTLPQIKVDLDELKLSLTNPFEKTGVSPTTNLIIGVETNRKIIQIKKEFMVIEPEIDVLLNDLPETSTKLNSKIENTRPDSKMNFDLQVSLKYQVNSVKVIVTDQTGRSVTSSFSIKLDVKTVTLEFEKNDGQAVDPGMGREIQFKTDPETTVYIGEKTYKADMAGKVKAKLDIVPGYNVFFTQLISKENVSYEYQIFIYGKRSIRMKSEQKFVFVDGNRIDIKVAPTTITYKFKSGRDKTIEVPVAYSPLRVLAENLFATVAYDAATKQITIVQKRPDRDRKIIFTVDSPIAVVDGQPYPINREYNIPTINKNGSVMIPTRFAATYLGAKVGFDNKTKEILLDWPDPNESTAPKQGTAKNP